MSEITKEQLDKYVNFLNQVLNNKEEGYPLSAHEITRMCKVTGAAPTVLILHNQAERIDGKLVPKYDYVEPIHARKLIENIRKYNYSSAAERTALQKELQKKLHKNIELSESKKEVFEASYQHSKTIELSRIKQFYERQIEDREAEIKRLNKRNKELEELNSQLEENGLKGLNNRLRLFERPLNEQGFVEFYEESLKRVGFLDEICNSYRIHTASYGNSKLSIEECKRDIVHFFTALPEQRTILTKHVLELGYVALVIDFYNCEIDFLDVDDLQI